MVYLDKIFCGSPNCKNDCGRQLTPELKAKNTSNEWVSYAYFCGKDESNPKLCAYVAREETVPKGFKILDGKVTIVE